MKCYIIFNCMLFYSEHGQKINLMQQFKLHILMPKNNLI